MFPSKNFILLLAILSGYYCADSDSHCQYRDDHHVLKLIYNQLKCAPKYGANNCIEEYDCPHASRPKDTCFFKGKTLQLNDQIDDADLSDVWASGCTCNKSFEFNCPELTDGCAEDWVGDYPKPRCYLRRELNSYCAADEICPPFEGNAECTVENKLYKEGEQFQHPTDRCTQCVCNKGFNLEAPFCQTVNCTSTMLENSKKIDEFCAPFYAIGKDYCCPSTWICPKEKDEHFLSPVPRINPTLRCKFGTNHMFLGDYLLQEDPELGTVTCECLTPPYLHCTVRPKHDLGVYD